MHTMHINALISLYQKNQLPVVAKSYFFRFQPEVELKKWLNQIDEDLIYPGR